MLLVKSGSKTLSHWCPHCPRKQTTDAAIGMSTKGSRLNWSMQHRRLTSHLWVPAWVKAESIQILAA